MYLFYIAIPFFAKGIVFGISAALSILPYTSFSKTNPPSYFWLSPQTQLPSLRLSPAIEAPIFAISAALLRPHTSFSNALTNLAA